MCVNSLQHISFSKTLENEAKFAHVSLSPFLCTCVTIEHFNRMENLPAETALLNM
jgi:hypothetical protein